MAAMLGMQLILLRNSKTTRREVQVAAQAVCGDQKWLTVLQGLLVMGRDLAVERRARSVWERSRPGSAAA